MAEISELLGMQPDRSGDIGELKHARCAGSNLAPERLRYQSTFWSVTEDDDGVEDRTGFAALRKLVERFMPHAATLADLRDGGETVLWWSGDSDSSQGGFVLEADLITSLSALGCHVYGTAFLHEGMALDSH